MKLARIKPNKLWHVADDSLGMKYHIAVCVNFKLYHLEEVETADYDRSKITCKKCIEYMDKIAKYN